MSLETTELACTSAPDDILHLIFQEPHPVTLIREARSPDGGSIWVFQDSIIAQDAQISGSPMTCYYVDKDPGFQKGPTIHVLYMNEDRQLMEKVKHLEGGTPIWTDVKVPDDIKKRPDLISRLTGGAFNGNSGWSVNGSQWVYFTQGQDGQLGIAEIRRSGGKDWYFQRILHEKQGELLQGTSLACMISEKNIKVFFQHHDGSICLYEYKDGDWHDQGVYVKKEEVQPPYQNPTPLACTMTKNGCIHLFFAGFDKNNKHKIRHYKDGKKQEDVTDFFSGSKLGCTSDNNEVTLFYRKKQPKNDVGTMVYSDGKWKDGAIVIPA
ncbi:d15452ca-2106-492e-ba4f-57a94a5540be [Sclerotinia trifoliorum]|uniref:D15452ca-2106-492e-ba4f-57a94a5540be n=1 Tax=Sclerotinia trifoliorum TaxID=28548 RepID=A0A8H2VP22_9HELO|nr:d15452ca-2106-492e-ba4f-57a94a5540be [Sclerotinia trifoliorum]